MPTCKIFLASSSELADDRKEFEILIRRKDNAWAKHGVRLELVIWEDFLDAMSQTRLQDEYNKAIRGCDIFVMLYCTKVGKYTAEEFETAFGQFQATNKPLIFTYFKDAEINTGSLNEEDVTSLFAFKKKLKQLGHFQTVYKNTEGLLLHFGQQLDKLADEGFILFEKEAPAAIPPLLTSPPFLPETFLGRSAEMAAIKQKLFTENHLLLLVNGEGGVGKTSLAAHYFHGQQNEYAHRAWLLCAGNITQALLGLAGPLGLRFEDALPANARFEQVLAVMAQLPRPCLLVLDNANELPDLDAHYLHLRRCPNFHVLLTTRITEFEAAATYRIEGLPEHEALQLFRAHYPQHRAQDDGLFQQMRAAVGGNTLVLELLAKNLHERNRLKTQYGLADLLRDLQSKGVLGLEHSAPVSTAYHAANRLRREKPEAIISAMYDLSALSAEETRLLSCFAVLPAESLPFGVLETVLASVEDLQPNLLALAQKGWLEYNAETTAFKCSPVVQEITKRKHAQLFEDCKPLLDALIDKLDYEAGVGHFLNATYEEAAVFARYGASVVAAFDEASRKLDLLCDRIGSYHETTGDLGQALWFYEKSLAITQALYESDPDDADAKNSLAISYEKLGATHTSLGNLAEALRFFEERSRLGKELYEAFPTNVAFKNGLAISYSKLGATHTSLGNLAEALRFFEDEIKLFEELYAAFPTNVAFKNGLAISYEKLGATHTSLGNLAEALRFFEERSRLGKELYEAFPINVAFKNGLAISYSKLGETHTSLGNLAEALRFFEKDLELTKELYEAFPTNVAFKNGLAISYSKLGATHTSLGNLAEALRFFEDFSRLMKELHEAFPTNVAFKNGLQISYEKLGDTYTALGDLDKAMKFYQDENALLLELYAAFSTNVAFKNGLAISYEKLGDTHTSLGNLAEALRFFEDETKLFEELYEAFPTNVAFKNGLAISYQFLGNTHSTLGNLDQALSAYEELSRLEKELYEAFPTNVEFKNGLAVSYIKLGLHHENAANPAAARAYFEQAATLWSQLVHRAPQFAEFKNNLAWVQEKLAGQ